MDFTKMSDLRIVDNFYQTSSFFPMPTTLIGTLCEDGSTSYGAYSLCFPFFIAGKDYYAIMLNCRNSSNTAKNILRTGKASINFIPAKKKYLKECVRLGFPGDTPKEKMKDFCMTQKSGLMEKENPDETFPTIIEESFQVYECSWVKELDNAENDKVLESYTAPFHTFNGITSEFGAHFILKLNKILMPNKFKDAIVNGVKTKDFPSIPINYGYRDSKNFWFSTKKSPYRESIQAKAVDVDSVMYAANRLDPEIKFAPDACLTMVKVPRVFLNTALKGCISWAKENHVSLLKKEHMEIIKNKRAQEKSNKK